MELFNSRILNREVDLEGDVNEVDVNTLAALEQMSEELSEEVLIHKKLIGDEFILIKKARVAARRNAEIAEKE